MIPDASLFTYLDRFANLHTAQSRKYWTEATRCRAPHKPILLLTVLDLIEQGSLQTNLIELTLELIELFGTYWDLVMPPERRGNLAMPFYHMKSDRFWTLLPAPGQEAALDALSTMTSLGQVRYVLLGARLEDDLFSLLQSTDARTQLRSVLITTYFATELHDALRKQGSINLAAFEYSHELLDRVKKLRDEPPDYVVPEKPVRDQGFRRVVVTIYDHRCALCGIRMRTADGHTVVDAAHIVPWSVNHNDDPRNGLALCRLCHWTFDKGLLGISGRYQIVVSSDLGSGDNISGHLSTLRDRPIFTPDDRDLWPDTQSLAWHRDQHGLQVR